MGIAEFDEVGTIVHQFASEDAIIKIGTALDPDLGDEIKVTVVATGMGREEGQESTPVHLIQKVNGGDRDNFSGMDTPTVLRQKKAEVRETRFGAQGKSTTDLDYLDIPAFLRRQAD